jgi:outer membrane protein assembly factor BamB
MRSLAIGIVLLSSIPFLFGGDWTDYRGPLRNGTSPEMNLPTQWSPKGENLAWKAPYGGRSAPVVMGDRVCVMNSVGEGATLQERVMCLSADTGKPLWEYRYNVYLSDVPPHRASWASPAIDPETGNVYAFGVGGKLLALSKDGKLLWDRSLSEEVGLVTTHGGRTVSPVVEGNLVIISGINSGWGDQARAAHRFMAFDKRSGQTLWVSTPGGRPYDTTYSPPTVAVIDGMPLLVAGGGDGTIHAIKLWTGEPVWKYEMSKRGINTGVAFNGPTAIVTHSEENLTTSEMGLMAALDASHKGDIGKEQVKWSKIGWQGGFSSPVVDGDRLYQVDNGANLYAFDINTGRVLWQHNLGTIQKASPVFGDGKLYVGSENGRFFILKPGQEKVEVLDEDDLAPEQIIASPAVSNGRVFLVTTENIYCFGKKNVTPAKAPDFQYKAPAGAKPVYLQVSPTELIVKPGQGVQLTARSFDANGRFIREEKAEWALDKLQGEIKNGKFSPAGTGPQAGQVKATANGVTAAARIRVVPPLPWSQNFESATPGPPPAHWINATGKSSIRDVEGNKVLVKHADNPFTKRARMYIGPSDWSDYTVEVDAMATEKRRQMGDAGVVAQRYNLILFGNHQRLELQSWQPETNRTVVTKFPWKPNIWYHVKLRVENTADGKVLARGKAWPASEPEPEKWLVERTEEHGNREGSPGIYADAANEVFFDNLKVTAN